MGEGYTQKCFVLSLNFFFWKFELFENQKLKDTLKFPQIIRKA
jgi:hypothetical protein